MKHLSASYSLVLRLQYPDAPGLLGRIATAIGEAEGSVGSVEVVSVDEGQITRDISVNARDAEHSQQIVARVGQIADIRVLSVVDRTFQLHEGGKIEVCGKTPVKTRDDLSMVYTPGVARVCKAIHADPDKSFGLTIRKNTVAVVSDGTAVLGLGDIGPRAAMPVMEGKCMLFKDFGGVDAFPICLDVGSHSVDEIVDTCMRLAPTFGGINLEDIASPRCVAIEERLTELVDIPVFHDDQHGTAVVVAAALKNALKLTGRRFEDIRVTIAGAGAAGSAIAKLLMALGTEQIVACDRSGAIHGHRDVGDNPVKRWLADNTNPDGVSGPLANAMRGADVFIGVSGPDILTVEDVKAMRENPIVLALSNPDPEIDPGLARPYAAVVATGRSDYPNQINNVLCFPGLFRGLLDVRACRVTDAMKTAAVNAIASLIGEGELTPDHVIPSVFDPRVAPAVAEAVAKAAIESGLARRVG